MDAIFRHGEPLQCDYTPSGAVTGGNVLVIGGRTAIAHNDIAAGKKGAVAVGGGVYRFNKTAGTSTAIAGTTKVYWDDSGKTPTTTASSNKVLGYTTPDGCLDADTTVDVVHDPSF